MTTATDNRTQFLDEAPVIPYYLLEYPMVVSVIKKEDELVSDALRTSTNPGKVWEAWKARITTQLQDVQKKL